MQTDKKITDWELVPVLLSKSLKLLNHTTSSVLRPYGLSSAHAMFLVVLSKNSGLTLSELSEVLSIDKAHTTRIVRDLKKKQYIFTDKENASSRGYKVFLTEEGMEAACDIKDSLYHLGKNVFTACVDQNEKEDFLKTMYKIIAYMKSDDFPNCKEGEETKCE